MNRKATFEKTGDLLQINNPVRHWRFQRLTAVALVPLSAWLLVLLDKALHAPYADTAAWLTTPLNGLAILAWTTAVIYHAALGVQVVIEDYVSDIALRHRAIIGVNLAFLILGAAALLTLFFIFLFR